MTSFKKRAPLINKKRAPFIQEKGLFRIIQQIYDDINELINAINKSALESRNFSQGKEGDIRVIKDSRTNTYKIEAYTKDGWASTDLTISKE